MPYPWSGPRVSMVFKTIRARVPCHTSVLSFMVRPYLVKAGRAKEAGRGAGCGPGGPPHSKPNNLFMRSMVVLLVANRKDSIGLYGKAIGGGQLFNYKAQRG